MKRKRVCSFIVLLSLIALFCPEVQGNAFLKSPTSRSSSWRYFGEASWHDDLTQNPDDMLLNCGGAYTDGNLQNKCGLCGDPISSNRPNEGPNGLYAIKRPTYIYYEGEEINVTVHVTARANGGFFQFKLCQSDSTTAATQACFDANPLKLASTTDQTLIQIPDVDGEVVVPLQLPAGVTCDYCVMQWVWVTARDWRCATINGQLVCGMGYGDQPTYVNCADFRILAQGAPFPSDFEAPDYNSVYASIFGDHGGDGVESTTAAPTQSTTQIQVVTTSTAATTTPSPTIPIITDPPTAATTSAATPGAATTTTELPSTSQIIIITPGTTQSPGTTEQPEVTTTTPRLTTEKLVPFPIGGGGGAVVAPFLGFNPLGLGLGGLGLLFAMGGGMSQGVPFAPAPVLPIASPPRVGPVGFSIPQPFVVQTGGEYPVQRSSWGVEYQQRPPPKGYGRSYRKSYIKSGYGNSYGRHHKRPSYQVNFQVNGVRQSGKNFFELPRNYITAPELGYAEELDVQITKEKEKKKQRRSRCNLRTAQNVHRLNKRAPNGTVVKNRLSMEMFIYSI